MTDKPDTSAAVLWEEARCLKEEASVRLRYADRDSANRCEELAALLRVLADEKEAWAAREAEAAAGREAWLKYIEEYGIEHLGGCPEDDTCECPLVAQINAALSSTAGRDLLARMERILSDRGILISMLRGMADATGESLDPEDEKVLQEIENDHAALRAAGYIIGTAEAAIRADQARRDAEIARETARRWRWGGRRNVNADFACDEIAAEIERRAGIGEEKSDD